MYGGEKSTLDIINNTCIVFNGCTCNSAQTYFNKLVLFFKAKYVVEE